MQLEDDQIEILLKGIHQQYVELQQKYNATKEFIQGMCKHTEIDDDSYTNRKYCKLCGQYIPRNRNIEVENTTTCVEREYMSWLIKDSLTKVRKMKNNNESEG